MIVHCSDGVGRAGTYVLIDMVLNRMMKGSKEIDIAATLEHIRDQRSGEIGGLKPLHFTIFSNSTALGFVYRFAAVYGFGKPGKSAAAAVVTLTAQGEMCHY